MRTNGKNKESQSISATPSSLTFTTKQVILLYKAQMINAMLPTKPTSLLLHFTTFTHKLIQHCI
jgi:hypothetical protein